MQLAEKQELIRLLNKYQNELLEENSRNFEREIKRKENDSERWKVENFPVAGIKAQYNHARCIVRKLSVEVEKDIRCW